MNPNIDKLTFSAEGQYLQNVYANFKFILGTTMKKRNQLKSAKQKYQPTLDAVRPSILPVAH